MARIANNITELIGSTPLVSLSKFSKKHETKATIIAKVESFNPMSSIKDRLALGLILDAQKAGKLTPASTIYEPTSGNTGVSLSFIGAALGYKVVVIMPDTMSVERRNLVVALGSTLVLTPGAQGMKCAIEKATELCNNDENGIILGQFTNPAGPAFHFETTAQEIWDDTDGEIDFFVAGVGTGGTMAGVAKFLKSKNPNITTIAVEPSASPVLSGGSPSPHKIQGLGAGFVPAIYDKSVVDEVFQVSNEQAFDFAREIAAVEGILVGISSGAALCAATAIAKKPENAGKKIVVILPDSGERYLSTALFSKE